VNPNCWPAPGGSDYDVNTAAYDDKRKGGMRTKDGTTNKSDA